MAAAGIVYINYVCVRIVA